MYTNISSDNILMKLRSTANKEYKIPFGKAFRFVSAPNYLGEMMEWVGFAVASWSVPALSFAVWTVANLAPRAYASHKWYQEKFLDYPKERKALVPFIW